MTIPSRVVLSHGSRICSRSRERSCYSACITFPGLITYNSKTGIPTYFCQVGGSYKTPPNIATCFVFFLLLSWRRLDTTLSTRQEHKAPLVSTHLPRLSLTVALATVYNCHTAEYHSAANSIRRLKSLIIVPWSVTEHSFLSPC